MTVNEPPKRIEKPITAQERRLAWVEFMAVSLQFKTPIEAAKNADFALYEFDERFSRETK